MKKRFLSLVLAGAAGASALLPVLPQKTQPASAVLLGDANGDGTVNIADVTALIDYLLGSGSVNVDAADINGDSTVNIADVTALIDKLLSGE